MKFLGGLEKLLKSAGGQIGGSYNMWRYEPDKREIAFTNKTISQIKHLGLSEKYALDVYYNGIMRDKGKMVKKYNGYEVGIFYMLAPDTAKVVITWIWKRDRR